MSRWYASTPPPRPGAERPRLIVEAESIGDAKAYAEGALGPAGLIVQATGVAGVLDAQVRRVDGVLEAREWTGSAWSAWRAA
jgi:hypothetical protein